MLRIDHMPSNFHPIFLFLGEADDLAALAAVLRRFASNPHDMPFDKAMPDSKSRAALTIAAVDDGFGMRAIGDGFEWRLNAWQAERIAERIDLLTKIGNKSGSDLFEVGSDGEIPVKVSRGEFTDDFLISKL